MKTSKHAVVVNGTEIGTFATRVAAEGAARDLRRATTGTIVRVVSL